MFYRIVFRALGASGPDDIGAVAELGTDKGGQAAHGTPRHFRDKAAASPP